MRNSGWRAAAFAALLLPGALVLPGMAAAQDVTLTARDGGITLNGTLQSYDGEVYRVETGYGRLTVDAEGVLCAGPGCPDLTAPFAVIRILGATDAGFALLPGLWQGFARARGLSMQLSMVDGGMAAEIADPVSRQPLAQVSFTPATPAGARAALEEGEAELIIAAMPEDGLEERVVALDALVPIVAGDHLVRAISTAELAAALAGEITNWRSLGGPDMPLVLHALESDTSLEQALSARLGRPIAAAVTHPDMASLAEAVARDPWALAVTGQSAQGAAREMPMTDSCGFPLLATSLSVKAGDYPLALPVYLVTPRRRLPLLAREFLDYLATPAAQAAVAQAGYIDRAPMLSPLSEDGARLINAIRGSGEETSLDELKRLSDAMAGADRLSLTFRFEEGSERLDAPSRANLADLVQLMDLGQFRGRELVFAGFSDGTGAAAANLDRSRARAGSVAEALAEALPQLPEGQLPPRIDGFGEGLPMACDTTVAGRHMNRRVEVWLRPAPVVPVDGAIDSPPL